MFTEDAKILMMSEDGLSQTYVKIGDVKAGDTAVSAKTGKPVTVVHCGYRVQSCARLCNVKKDAFGENCPFEDVVAIDSVRIMMSILNTKNTSSFPLLLFPEKAHGLYFINRTKFYIVDLEDNHEGVIVCGLPLQPLESNGLWERMGMTPN
jgi:hypothetical protein